MSASPKPPTAPPTSLGAPRRPSASRAAPLFEVGVPAPAPLPRPSGPRLAPHPRPPPAPAARPVPPNLRRRRRQSAWPFYVAIGLILLALPAGYFLLLQDTPPSSQELAVPGKPVELKLTRVDGTVEIRRASGQWGQVQAGAVLQPSDGVRTGAG